jgi:hypothetical protein
VAHVRDGFAVQTNIVRQDGVRGVLMSMYKLGGLDAYRGRGDQSDCAESAQVAAARALRSRRCSTSRCLCAPRSQGVLREGADCGGLLTAA